MPAGDSGSTNRLLQADADKAIRTSTEETREETERGEEARPTARGVSSAVKSGSLPPDSSKRVSLYDDIRDVIEASVWMYLIADLRELAQRELLAHPDSATDRAIQNLVNLPVTAKDLEIVLKSNLESLTRRQEAKTDLYLTSIQKFISRNDEMSGTSKNEEEAAIVHYDDENKNSECVYAIVRASPRRRILVSFRGSATTKDWLMNMQAALRDTPNPVGQPDVVGIHHGFQEYLYGQLNTKDAAVRPRRRVRRYDLANKCQKILSQASELLVENPGYSLWIIGHSLGGALASQLAFQAAASEDPRIPKPVTCLTVGAPKSGNLQFRLAMESLERMGKLRLVRVENRGDPVPLVPDLAPNVHKKSFLHNSYYHVGFRLYLFPKWRNRYQMEHPTSGGKGPCHLCVSAIARRVKRSFCVLLCAPLACLSLCKLSHSAMIAHGCLEYMRRLEHHKTSLEKLCFDDMYDNFLESRDWRSSREPRTD